MQDLHLGDSEQAAIRDLLASEPVAGMTRPGECALPSLARLIPCDALGIAVLDGAGSTVDESVMRRNLTGDDVPAPEGPALGVRHLDRAPPPDDSSSSRGVAVLALGVRNGPDHVVKLWMIRRCRNFSPRDRALLELLEPALARLLRERPTSELPPSLTLQERRVLRLVAAGLSNAEIAVRLCVETSTVRKHLEHAYRKLGVTNRTAAVFALEGGRRVADGPLVVDDALL